MNEFKNIYIIIVTYNGKQWLEKCLKSCANYPVIVVDNHSSDGTIDFIRTHFSDVKILPQSENKGFGQANNIGIAYALKQGAEQVFLLNQDAYLVDDVLEQLVSFQKANPDYGILSPIHTSGNGMALDKNFSLFLMREASSRQLYADFVLGNPIALVYNVSFINAAGWLLSKYCLETVGGFDPLFFHYAEDDNYCQRVLFHNLKIGIIPKAYISHDRSNRKATKQEEFSAMYYKNLDRKFRLKHANVNEPHDIDRDIEKLKRSILKLKLQGRFGRAAMHKITLNLYLKAKPEIERSRNINKQPGTHYL